MSGKLSSCQTQRIDSSGEIRQISHLPEWEARPCRLFAPSQSDRGTQKASYFGMPFVFILHYRSGA